ncbi:translocator protein 2 [Octodon degus]|uniref:Translocator protein 2 n=1 Tax=Octodon degus TaxID=10160 RepID=A0A6P3EVZ6_OCTDE|nr:translocator protein 2 [Octodon degus]
MQPQGPIFVGLPHLGLLPWLFTRYSVTDWCKGLRTLPWCPPYKTVLLVWTTTYFLIGYASYLIWKDLRGDCKWRLALPLGLYTVQLLISWVVLMLFLEAVNPGLALLPLLLLYGLVVSMVLVWHPINKLAALLLLPYLAWLTVMAVLTYRLWRDSLCPTAQPQPTGESGS